MYAETTNQLGSFLKMVSSQLTESKFNTDADSKERVTRRRLKNSREKRKKLLPWRKSTILDNNSYEQNISESLILSRSISCIDFNYDSSYQRENGCILKDIVGRVSEQSQEEERHNKNKLKSLSDDTNDANTSEDDKSTDEQSLASIYTSSVEKTVHSKSRRKTTLRRMTSFLTKKKATNANIASSTSHSEKASGYIIYKSGLNYDISF